MANGLISRLDDQLEPMLELLEKLVNADSFSKDLEAVSACADILSAEATKLLGLASERFERDGRPHLLLDLGGEPSVLLIGHFDTVFPTGSARARPFTVTDERATGPGVFDMKAGLVQGLFAIHALEDRSGIRFLMNSDEEIGSESSKPDIEQLAKSCKSVMVLEPSEKGALKVGRKGVSEFQFEIVGRAAHAGLEPEKGINALIELAHQVGIIAELNKPELGTTVSPTVATAGSTVNTIPDSALLSVDVRTLTAEEHSRVTNAMHDLRPHFTGAEVRIVKERSRPPMTEEVSSRLFSLAQRIAVDLDLEPLDGVTVGGGSDGNITAAVGVPTLDGLGAVGAGAHTEDEYVEVKEMPKRAALVAALIEELRKT